MDILLAAATVAGAIAAVIGAIYVIRSRRTPQPVRVGLVLTIRRPEPGYGPFRVSTPAMPGTWGPAPRPHAP